MPLMTARQDESGRIILDKELIDHVKQRAPDWSRQPGISQYLTKEERKFGPIIAVLSPAWIDEPDHENWGSDGRALKDALEFKPLDPEGKVGLLKVNPSDGSVLIYALDGQHRIIGMKGIKEVRDEGSLIWKNKDKSPTSKKMSKEEFLEHTKLSISKLQSLLGDTMGVEYLPAVLAGETRKEASQRIRKVFTVINNYQKKTDKSENVSIDENDGFASIGRNAGVHHVLFNGGESGKNRVNWKTATIPKTRTTWYTTLQTLRQMALEYLPVVDFKFESWKPDPMFKDSVPDTPTAEYLDDGISRFNEFLDYVFQLPIFQELEGHPGESLSEELEKVREFPTDNKPEAESLLLRPHGQIILAKAVAELISDNNLSLDFRKYPNLTEKVVFRYQQNSVWKGVTFDGKNQG